MELRKTKQNRHQQPALRIPFPRKEERGFSLIATITLLVLLALIAVAVLSLSTVTLRATSATKAQAEARANARLALNMALAELQATIGDDRRITADASILSNAAQPHALGVWESWSPRLAASPTDEGPDYEEAKEQRFLRWLVSGDREERSEESWAEQGPRPAASIELFREATDGFTLSGNQMIVLKDRSEGRMAWAVAQDGTKAKVAVAGPEKARRTVNDDLQVQPRPSLGVIDFFGEPTDEWDRRAARVLDTNQMALDKDIWTGPASVQGGAHFTAVGAGLATNVVDGGLKTDLSLGFEMSDADFDKEEWSGEGYSFKNPFHSANEEEFKVASTYENQRPLFEPLAEGTYQVRQPFWPANVHYFFPVTSVPTFHSLRSYARIPHHLYRKDGDVTVFEREADHVAADPGTAARGFFDPPPAGFRGQRTQVGIRPVMDRIMFLISAGMESDGELRIVITPIVTLWNPYNVALDIEGAVAHVWIDIPYDFRWRTYSNRGRLQSNDYMYVSGLMGQQFIQQQHGRSVDPYFYAAMTADGDPLSDSGTNESIHFEPGEVRVFAPAQQDLLDFEVDASIRERTVFLRPVDSLDQFTTEGGLSVPTFNPVRNIGFKRKLKQGEAAQLTFSAIPNEDYPFYISLEDATRAKGSNPDHDDRGQAIADILANSFSRSGEVVTFKSPRISFSELRDEPIPIGVLESYHRTAQGSDENQPADLVFTGNPRQPWMNPFISNTSFKTGPQYQMRMRAVSSFNGVLQSAEGGRSAYYGATQTPNGGRTNLSFFEIPRSPILSMAGLQHCDLTKTPFAPANQIANSWASAYVPREKVTDGELNVDYCYLFNEALWDRFFFSGAAPTLNPRSGSGSDEVWENEIAGTSVELEDLLERYAQDPNLTPLRNPRMKPVKLPADPEAWAERLVRPEGCMTIASELFIDGAFNVNSTSVEAWKAVLAGLRDASFEVDGEEVTISGATPFPRFRDPVGEEDDEWNGFRTLDDAEIESLAEELVAEVRERGPFLSLAEFVNRRVTGADLGLTGAVQAAIDRAGLNEDYLQESFSTSNYNPGSRANIVPTDTGVGIPGYLTQADVLKSLAPVISVRSDTFTVRAYGDSRDATGKVVARARIEAIVQRYPEFVDQADQPFKAIDDLNGVNATFGRRLKVISIRYIPDSEMAG